jgi:hypothetical protein
MSDDRQYEREKLEGKRGNENNGGKRKEVVLLHNGM